MRVGASTAPLNFPADFFPTEGFTHQLHALCARVLVLEKEERHAILVLEMTSLPPEEVEMLQGILREETGAAHCHVLVTHTFSAPHFLPEHALTSDAQRQARQALKAAVCQAVHRAAKDAAETLTEATAILGVAQCAVATARDVLTPDGWWVGSNGPGQADRRMTVTEWKTADGKPAAAMVHYAIQSSVLDGVELASGGKAVSGDLAGQMCARLEEKWHIPVLFLIGAAGNQAPGQKGKTEWFENGARTETDLHEAALPLLERQAGEMAEAAEAALAAAKPMRGDALQYASRTVSLPGKVINRNLRELHPTKIPNYEPAEPSEQTVSLLQIGELKLIGVKPELNGATAAQIAASDPMVRVVTLWNGGAKYIADKASCELVTYESQNSPFYPGAAELLAQAARELLNS